MLIQRMFVPTANLKEIQEDEDGCPEYGRQVLLHWELTGQCPTCGTNLEDDYIVSVTHSGDIGTLDVEESYPVTEIHSTTFNLPGSGSGNLMQITYVDVDKGDCIVTKFGNTLCFYDTGYQKYNDRIMAVVDQLDIAEILHCIVIVSHNDKDHSGGYNELLAQLKVRFNNSVKCHIVFESASLTDGFICQTNATVHNNQVHFVINEVHIACHLSPPHITGSNERSIVTVIEHKQDRWISVLTGDQSLPNVMQIVNKWYSGLPIHLFQIPHHGSLHNYKKEVLPPAANYLVSGSPMLDGGNNNTYNKKCQIEAVEQATQACEDKHFNIHFTKPYLDNSEVAKHSKSRATMIA